MSHGEAAPEAGRSEPILSVPRSEPGGAPRGGVRRVLERVVERREIGAGHAERGRGQPVGEPGVLGKQRAVEVGADHRSVGAAADALEAARDRRCRGP